MAAKILSTIDTVTEDKEDLSSETPAINGSSSPHIDETSSDLDSHSSKKSADSEKFSKSTSSLKKISGSQINKIKRDNFLIKSKEEKDKVTEITKINSKREHSSDKVTEMTKINNKENSSDKVVKKIINSNKKNISEKLGDQKKREISLDKTDKAKDSKGETSDKLTGKDKLTEKDKNKCTQFSATDAKDKIKSGNENSLDKNSKPTSEDALISKVPNISSDSKGDSLVPSLGKNSNANHSISENIEKNMRNSDDTPFTDSKDKPTENGEFSVCSSADSKDKPAENGEFSSKETSRPDTPLSHASIDLDLEESLLKDDTNLQNEDNEDFCEDKLLQGIDDETLLKDKSVVDSSKSDDAKFRDQKIEKSSDSDRQEKEIEKIIKNLNSSIGKNDKSSSSDKAIKNTVEPSSESISSSDKGIKSTVEPSTNSNSSSKPKSNTKFSDESSNGTRSNSLLPGTSSSKTSGKRSCPDDKKSFSNSSSNKLLKLDDKKNKEASNDASEISGKEKAAPERKKKLGPSSKLVSKKNAITFSEALKSIAMENKQSQLLSIDKPQPLVPITEISTNEIGPPSASLTVLGAMDTQTHTVESNLPRSPSPVPLVVDLDTDVQGKKRPLSESDDPVNGSKKPELKKMRAFRKENNKNNDPKEISKSMEFSTSMASRLQEEKAQQESAKSTTNGTLEKEGLICIGQEDLQRKTVQEMQKANLNNFKLKRIKRKDLESLVIELFVDKVLYEHQLGQQKDLCKRLEATMETNRKKAAQFHKEIEDLKKVTQRLQAEHLARKGQVIAPVKVKRSVGIQATPSIIGKGLMHASSNGNIRVLSPTANVTSANGISSRSVSSNQVSIVAKSTSSSSTSSNSTQTKIPPPPITISAKTAQIPKADLKFPNNVTKPLTSVNDSLKMLQPGAVVAVVNPAVMQQPQNVVAGPQILPVSSPRVIRTPLTPISPATAIGQGNNNSSSNSSSSTFIDLTDDEEAASKARTALQPGSLVAIQRTPGVNINQSASGQFVTLSPPTSVGQLVLVPSTPGQGTTALVVGSVANSTQSLSTISTGVVRSAGLTQNANVRYSTNIVNTTRVVVGAQVNGTNFVAIPRHPAPLPRAPPQQTSGYSKKLPPVPILKLSHKENSIVLSWNMARTEEHERVASYQLYAYQEGTAAPTPALWKKVGSVKALELPMACTLTQFMPGHVYHFAVRAVDIRSRLGPFSDPKSIRLGK